ncbi:MAG: PAS domain S-box protein [Actinomycetota bacterium]|nr:PAS domain S-box protein [Actinomycetota bacterium]
MPDQATPSALGKFSPEWFRTLIEQLPLTVYVDRLDESSSTVYTSPQVAGILGYAPEEWAEDPDLFRKVLHPEDRARVIAEHRRARGTDEPLCIEYRMIARDGRVVWFLDQASVVHDEAGRPAFHHGFLLDITERKELEEALRRSEAELRRQKHHLESLLEISPTAIITLGRDRAVTSWNLAAADLFGYSSDEAVGHDLAELIANREDLRVETAEYFDEFLRTGRFQAVTRRARKDGSLLDVEVFAVPIAADGEPTGYLVVYRDVTAIRAQQEAERRYRDLVEHLPLVTYVDEPTAAASSIYISPQVESLVGYSPEEWIADPDLFSKLLHPDDRDRVLADHERVFSAAEPSFSFEYRLVARDGRTVWIRDDAVVVTDDDGRPVYVQGFLINVTERKLAEEALRQSETRFRVMFEEAPIGIAWGPLDGDVPLVPASLRRSEGPSVYRRNRAYREMLGYSEEELEALHFTEYTHPDDLARELELYRDLVAGRIDRYQLEKRYLRRDGSIVWGHVVDSILRDDGGRPLFGLTMVQDITQRREAEEALRESEAELRRQMQYLQSLLEISPVAVVTLDLRERVTSWNPAAEKLFGYSKAEALGVRIADLILRSEALHEEGVAVTEEALEHGSAQRLTRRMRKDGTLVDVEVLLVPLHVDGARVGFYVIYHDVSALQRQKQYYESLLEISPTAIVTVDLDDNVSSWNPAAEKLFGYPREEAIGRNIDELVCGSEELRAEGREVNRRGSKEELELVTRRTRKDGTVVDVQLRIAPVFFEGELVGRYGIYHDISELQRQKQYFQSLLDNSPTAVAGIDLSQTVTAWNPAAENLFGYTRDEAVGRNIDDLVARSKEVHAEAVRLNRKAIEEGEAHLVTQRTRKDGTLVDVEVLVAPVIVAGELHGFYAIYHDVSDLLRARHEAETANRAKSAFLATMSHEIRTPMNAVIGMSGLLLETELTREQREYAEIVSASGDALLKIIDDILDFSKIEAEKLELENQPFALRPCIEAALDVVAKRASEKGLDLACMLDSGAPRAIVGDATRLRQILINLLSNAVKFTESGEVVVSLEATALRDGLHDLHFAVRDTGIGIPAERMDRLFESFSQVDASTTRRYGGTGLGLAISRRLAELMGGKMWAESDVGKGSTFHFTILAEEAPALVPTYDKPAQPQLAGKRVLVVDDNATNREILLRYTESWGMATNATAAPAEALAWIERGERFDVALLDLRMPDMDGVALAREIRRHRDAEALPLVVLTSLGRRKEDGHPDIEFAAYLTKPIKASQLYETLIEVLAAKPAAEPRATAETATGEAPGEQAVTILVAEDNEVNQKLALAVLAKLGYRADVAANGVEALAALGEKRYDAVLMDVEMPEMDGLEAARRIRARWPREEGPRIIAMTANAMQGDREICLAAGMDDYLAKPVRPEQLAAALGASKRTAPGKRASRGEDGEVLDLAAIERLRETFGEEGHGFVDGLIGTFLAEAPALLATLREGLEREDSETVRRVAHTLKSNARTFGASALADACEELEKRARRGPLDGAAPLVERVEEAYRRAEPALEAERREGE